MRLYGPNGKVLEMSKGGRALVYGVSVPEERFANELGKSFSILVDVTPGTTDDDFFYLKNNEIENLVIHRITGWCTADQEISIFLGATDAGTDAGDALTAKAMNADHTGHALSIDCTQDATDLAITGGEIIDVLKFSPTALTPQTFLFSEGIIVPKGTRLHMQAALAALINLNIFFHFHTDSLEID
jgi:hypothetical protein